MLKLVIISFGDQSMHCGKISDQMDKNIIVRENMTEDKKDEK